MILANMKMRDFALTPQPDPCNLTCIEQGDSLEARVFSRIHVQHFQAFHLLLEGSDMVHESNDAVCAEWGRVQSGRG